MNNLIKVNWANEFDLKNLKGIIYRIVNIKNGKSYIGKSINTFYERYKGIRWWEHDYVLSKMLIRAINKYGIDNFKIQILEDTIENENYLLLLESYYAKLYNTYKPFGYNLIDCGIKGGDTSKKIYLRDKNENLIEIINITKWCKQNGLRDVSIFRVLSHKDWYYKEWHLPEFSLEECIKLGKMKYTKLFIFKFIDNKNYIVKNLKDFCINNELNINIIRNILYKRKFKLPYKNIIQISEI